LVSALRNGSKLRFSSIILLTLFYAWDCKPIRNGQIVSLDREIVLEAVKKNGLVIPEEFIDKSLLKGGSRC